ncbi:MAG: DUF2917 domain-containing protein [Comamonadaceae bacterium]|nr:MAG: DUF2917 domain-containing protein [Comamonadaceae bacterium]
MQATFLDSVSTSSIARGRPVARRVCFEVPPAAALTFVATESSILRVTRGRLWATRDLAGAEPAEDVVLGEGASMRLARGERLVLESWSTGQADAAWFSCEADPA